MLRLNSSRSMASGILVVRLAVLVQRRILPLHKVIIRAHIQRIQSQHLQLDTGERLAKVVLPLEDDYLR